MNALIARPVVPDVVGQMARGNALGVQMRGQRAQNALAQSVQQNGPMSPQAMNALAGVNPQGAMEMAQGQMTAQREVMKERAAALATGILSAPEADRPQLYAQGLQEYAALGGDVSSLPAEYPGDMGMRMIAGLTAMPDDERSEFERLTANMPPEQRQRALMVKLGLEPRAQSGAAPRPLTNIAKLRADLEAGRITQDEFNALAAQEMAGSNGITYEGPDGTRIQVGGSGGTELGRAGRNAVDQLNINAEEQLSRLDRIDTRIEENPELLDGQSLIGQLKRFGLEWTDYLTGGDLTTEQAEYLTQVTQLRADVLQNLNATIKEITGFAMTESEAVRIGGTVPNVEDGPTVFVAKLRAAQDRTRAAIARYNYWRNGGFGSDAQNPWDGASLADMNDLIDNRIRELYEAAIAEGEDENAALTRAAALASQEFGI